MQTIKKIYEKISNIIYDENYIETMLNGRQRNNNDIDYVMSSEDLKKIYSLDEFIYLIIKNNEIYKYKETFEQYMKIISNQLKNEPLLLLSLPLWKIDKTNLQRYLPNYNLIINKINEYQNEANIIFKKFEISPSQVSKNELHKLIRFFTYATPYANEKMINAQEITAKYLLNYSSDDNIYNNYEITIFLIKFFGYKKIKEEGLEDTKIIIGNLKETIRGESTENYVIINKQLLKKVLLQKNILEDQFGRQNIRNLRTQRKETHNEILGILHTVYHEIRHQLQKKHSETHKINDLSYYYSSYEIINKNDQREYHKNYRCYEIEKDANYKAWENIEVLIKQYITTKNIGLTMRNILSHKLKEELEQITGIRKDDNNRVYASNDLLIKLLDTKIKNNPYQTLKEYPQLLNFYLTNGTPKRVIELLKIPLIYDYKDFYFGQVNYRFKIYESQLTYNDLKSQNTKDIQVIINNIKILIDITREKINKISDRIRKYNEPISDLNLNIINYYEFAISLSNTIKKIISIYPNILSIPSIKYSISSINDSIDMINNNNLIIKIYNNQKKISRIGSR